MNEQPDNLKVGFLLGHYRIVSKIGAGGMGEVYLANDMRLDRRVALKILPPEFAEDADRMSRFVREAKSASSLNHPNIITIHEIGESDGTHFIAAEFIDGKTLSDYEKSNSLNYKSALEIAIQIASALDEAHSAGIVHRDIKPDNVMIRSNGLVKILDFGIAKLSAPISADAEAATAIKAGTSPGMIIGTANYMSPEQAKGKEVDTRTDIFSFGVLLYEMIAGELPFAGENALEMIGSILKDDPKSLTSDVPAEITKIVNKCLRKDRDERYQTIKDVGNDLKSVKQDLEFQDKLERSIVPNWDENKTQILQAATIDELHQTTTNQTLSSNSQNRYLAIASAVLLLSVVGFFGYKYFVPSTKQIESIAVMPFVNESGNSEAEYLSDGMTETLINSLSQIPNLSVKARSSVFRYKGKDTNPQMIGKELNVQAILNGRVVQRGDELVLYLELVDAATGNQIWGDQYDKKLTNLVSLQSEIARDVSQKLKTKLSGADEQKLAKTYTTNPQAYQLYLQGRFHWNKRTEKDIKESIDYFNQAIALDPNYALAYAGLADSYVVLPEYSDIPPSETFPKAKAAAEKALKIDDTLGEALLTLAVDKQDYDLAGAERDFQKAIALNPNYPTAHQWYGEFLGLLGRMDESLAELRRAQELDPLSLIINKQLGTNLLFARRYDEAIAQERKVLDMDADFAPAYRDLGWCYTKKGMYDEAIVNFQKAISLTDGNSSKVIGLAYAFAKSGRRDEARKILEKLKARQKTEKVDPGDFAVIYAALGEKDEAFADLDKALQEHSQAAAYLKVDPAFDDLRDDPRFSDLLRRMNLPQ